MPADETLVPPPARATRVVVVEDEQSISDPLRSALEREGYMVEVASTGAAGLEAVRRDEPDVVLLDLMLPDIDGRDVCRTIRSSSRVPIIMLTARGLETDRVVGLELGADDYLVKPFGMAELVARIRAVLRRSGGRRSTGGRRDRDRGRPPRRRARDRRRTPPHRSICRGASSTSCTCSWRTPAPCSHARS